MITIYKEFLKKARKRSLKAYHEMMADPVRAESYRAKRREYERKRYREMKDRG